MANTVHAKLVSVLQGVKGLAKDKKNDFHKYAYQSAEGFYNAYHEPFAEAGLVVYPRVLSRDYNFFHGEDSKGKPVTNVHCALLCDFIFTDGESEYVARGAGEGVDNGDKAVYKAMTGAFKQTLKIVMMAGTDTDSSDPDKESPQLGAKQSKKVEKEAAPDTEAQSLFKDLRQVIQAQGKDDLTAYAKGVLVKAGFSDIIPPGKSPDAYLLKTLLFNEGVTIDETNTFAGLTPEVYGRVSRFLAKYLSDVTGKATT